VQRIDARYAGVWELPALGTVVAPTAVLLRPDGHVAWVGDGTDQGLRDALTTWFGPALMRAGDGAAADFVADGHLTAVDSDRPKP
jgi:hypothetical protein